jgi:hypothetical protein
MHILIVLIDLGGVRLRGKPSKALLEHIDPERLIASDKHINAQVKLMPVDQEGVSYVARYHRGVVHVYIIDIVYYVDTLALAGVCRLHYPYVLFRVVLLKLLVVGIEITKFIWENVGVWDKVKWGFTELFLHSNHIVAETILARDLIGLREVIDFLELIQTLIEVTLAGGRTPEDIPLV